MAKKFWKRGSVSRLLRQRQEALKRRFSMVRSRRPDVEALLRGLPELLKLWEGGVEVLDAGFPIREGQGQVDYLASNREGELIFIWAKRLCNSELLSKFLPDYDWIQKNQALWAHLFPLLLERRQLRMKVWLFALEIDPEVKYLLSYLHGIHLQLFLASPDSKSGAAAWQLIPWERCQQERSPASAPVLPSSPPVLSILPSPPAVVREESSSLPRPLISQEELNDLIGITPETESWQEDEVTDPYYDPAQAEEG